MSLTNSIDALPAELQLTLIGFLPLTAVIMMRGVSKHWKNLIEANLEKPHVVHPARSGLYLIWQEFISHRWFLKSRQYTLPLIKPFDREEYIRKLPSSGVPLAFEMWIREWPSSAVIGWIWPGLDGKAFDDGEWCWWRSPHINRLSAEDGGPTINSLEPSHSFYGNTPVNAIHILKALHEDDTDVMLALHCEYESLSGSVQGTCQDSRIVTAGAWRAGVSYSSWTSYLFQYIREIDDVCRDYYRNQERNTLYCSYPELKIMGHEWKEVGLLGEPEDDVPKDLDADEDPEDRQWREYCECMEMEELFDALGDPRDWDMSHLGDLNVGSEQ